MFLVCSITEFFETKKFLTAKCVDLGGTLKNSGTAVLREVACGCPLHSRRKFGKMLTLRFIVDFERAN